ncbi:MAG: hypothetical protein RL577_505 [Bacteroidota bacterium]|jgi:hypothetical protein
MLYEDRPFLMNLPASRRTTLSLKGAGIGVGMVLSMWLHVGYDRKHGRAVEVYFDNYIGDDVLILGKSTGQVLMNHETTAVTQVRELYANGSVSLWTLSKLNSIEFITRGGFDQNDVGDFHHLIVVFSWMLGIGIGIYMFLGVGI